MKYKVTLKVSYLQTQFLFDDRMEALDFMETLWAHREKNGALAGIEALTEPPTLSIVEEEA